MGKIVKTMKLRIDTDEAADRLFRELTERYASACNEISQYMFDHEFPMNFVELKNVMYHQLRDCYGLKSQMTLSSFKTVIRDIRQFKHNCQIAHSVTKMQMENGRASIGLWNGYGGRSIFAGLRRILSVEGITLL